MNQGILLGPDGRPWTKAEVEAETARRAAEIVSENARRAVMPIAVPIFSGPHPFDTALEGSQSNWDRSFTEFEIEASKAFVVPTNDEHAGLSAGAIQNGPGYNDGWVKRNPIAEFAKPHDNFNIMNQSMKYAEGHWIVNRAVKVKKNFALRDMQVISKNESARERIHTEFQRLKIRSLISHTFRYHEITGRVVWYWGSKRDQFGRIPGVCILDPRYVTVRRMLNVEKAWLNPLPVWVSASRAKSDSPEFQWLIQNIPPTWLNYIKNGMEIPLEDGTYTIIENDLSLFDVRGIGASVVSGVPLSACWNALQISCMLMAADFSTAWMMKNQYVLISQGDPKSDNYVPPDQPALNKLANTFQRPEYSIVAYVDPTVNIRFFSPDPAAMGSERYKQSTEAIEYVMGVPGVFTNAQGSFAAGAMSIKPFREDIVNMRANVVTQGLWPLMQVIREDMGKRVRSVDVHVHFDENCLKDDTQLWKELAGKWDRGAISNRALLEGRHGDLDMEIQRKTEELPHAALLQPLFDVAHGTDETVGRPSEGGAPTHEGSTGTHTPRPSAPN
jgi:hypothetical protein